MLLWGCPINAVLKVVLKTKIRPVGDKIQTNWIDIYQHVLIETKQYLVLIRFFIWVSNLTFLDFVMFGILFSKNVNLKNGIFKICFRQSAKCKMTAQTGRTYHVFVKICNLECICHQNVDFWAPTTFAFSLSNQFILQEVCFLCVQ